MPDYDDWFYDSAKLVRMIFTDSDTLLLGELIDHPADITAAKLLP